MTQLTYAPADLGVEDRALKARHATMWALGNYDAVATEVVGQLGDVLVEATGIEPGQTVLDVAAGSGNAAIPAARRGAEVTASDLTPQLLERGRRHAEAAGLTLRWEVGDAEALPYPDATFDTVISCLGVMFAPHHQVAAGELTRVCRPGGQIALLSWTPAGFIGQMFATMKSYAPPPPPGAQPAPLWGVPEHVTELLGDRVVELIADTRSLAVGNFATGAQFRDYFKANYGPTIAVYTFLGADTARVAELDAALADLGDRYLVDGQMSWEYLVVTARRA